MLKCVQKNIKGIFYIMRNFYAFDIFFTSFDNSFDNLLTYKEISSNWELSWTYVTRVINNNIVDYFNSKFLIQPPNQYNFSVYAIKTSPNSKNWYLDLQGLKDTILSVGAPEAYLVTNEKLIKEIFGLFDTSLDNQIDYDEFTMNWKLAFTYSVSFLTKCTNMKSYQDTCIIDCECKTKIFCNNELCE